MPRVPLTSGAYSSQSLIANAQRCVNLYPEANPPATNPPVPVTHYPTPGLRLLGRPTTPGTGRGLYRATNGDLYAVVGNTIYSVDSGFNFTARGTLTDSRTPVSMTDNSIDLGIVNGSDTLYLIKLEDQSFRTVRDVAFYATDRIDYVDTFFVFNRSGTNQFFVSDSSSTTFDPLYIAAKTGGPDTIVAVAVLRREVWLLGTRTTEVWSNVGAAEFPFQALPGVFIDHGCLAKNSVAQFDRALYLLSQDKQGQCIVVRASQEGGYGFARISTHAIEQEIQQYARQDDAIGFCYQQNGHTFYQLTFPSADKTWVYDIGTEQWHERAWCDQNGVLHRHRAAAFAFAYGTVCVLDWETGALYALDTQRYTDDGAPIVHIRSFPHLMRDNKRVIYRQFQADMEVGNLSGGTTEDPPQITLRWSDTRGAAWGDGLLQSMGSTGEYSVVPTWWQLGMARDRVFELSWSVDAPTALNGAFIEFVAGNS